MRKLDARQLAREKSLFRYSSALERGDFETIQTVLKEAEHDPLLARMIAEINTVYESETFRLSPSLNHSSNHREKDLVMTTIVLPNRQRNSQRWLPITLAAACVSVLFIGALMLRPMRPNNGLAVLQAQSSATLEVSSTPTLIPTATPMAAAQLEATLPPTIVPPDAPVAATGNISDVTCSSKDAVITSPANNSVVAGTVDVSGIANTPNFGSFQLEIIGLGTGSKYLSILAGSQPVIGEGPLGKVNLSSFPPENYGLRLSVFDNAQQLQGRCLVNITVARAAAVSDDEVSASTAITVIPANAFPVEAVVTTKSSTYSQPMVNSDMGIILTIGAIVHVDVQADFGKWSHVVLEGGKNGWVLSNVLRFETANSQAASSVAEKGTVIWSSVLREEPHDKATAIVTVEPNTVVTVNNTSVDGFWKHIILSDGSRGWLSSAAIQIDGILQVDAPSIICSGTVGSQPAMIYSRPVFSSTGVVLNTLKAGTHVSIVDLDSQSSNQLWYYIESFDDNTIQGWVPAAYFTDLNNCPQITQTNQFAVVAPTLVPTVTIEAATAIVPDVQIAASAVGMPVCGGLKVMVEDTQVHARPSNNSSIVGGIPAGTQVEALVTGLPAEDDTSATKSDWFFVKADVAGNPVQGWVRANSTKPLDPTNSCPNVAVGTTNTGAVPQSAIASNDTNPAAIGTAIPQITFNLSCNPVTMDGTTAHVTNQTDKAVTLYAAPLTRNSEAAVVGEFAARSEAILLYQQYDRQSDPVGAMWYLVMTNAEGDKQVTGWVSAKSITPATGCSTDKTDASDAAVAVMPIQLQSITGIATTASSLTGTCRVINTTGQPVTLFATPLTNDSNAPVVGTLPTDAGAVVIVQNYDPQSAPVGALWYLVQVDGNSKPQISGWISASSIQSPRRCAPEQLTGVTLSAVTVAKEQANPVPVPSVADSAQMDSCQVTNNTHEAIPMFAEPLTKNSNAPVIGKFAPASKATITLQNFDRESSPVGALWYLITTSDKNPVIGWISANNLDITNACSDRTNGVTVPAVVPTVAPAQASAQAVTGICQVIVEQKDSVPVYSGPSSAGDESVLVNNLPPNFPATVLYQQVNRQTGTTWYLILAVMDQGKQISGWVSSDSVKLVDRCPSMP